METGQAFLGLWKTSLVKVIHNDPLMFLCQELIIEDGGESCSVFLDAEPLWGATQTFRKLDSMAPLCPDRAGPFPCSYGCVKTGSFPFCWLMYHTCRPLSHKSVLKLVYAQKLWQREE